jgi:predicted dehydrogenase
MAMRMGKHCFCQKPLTHSIYEARLMAETAREKKVITQMGNQGTALACLRKSAALVRAGVIGAVREVHIWTNRPVWPQSTGLKVAELDPPPADIHWAEWIGPAEYRPFSHEIHPFKWRGFWDFGTGALGDMACHTLNMAYMALDLRNPTRVVAETAGHDGNCYPKWSVIEFEFPERNGRPPVKLFWYDGGKMPRMSLLKGCPKMPTPDEESAAPKHYDSAALVIGDKGKFYSPGDYGGEELTTGAVFGDEFVPQDKLPESDIDVVRSSGHFTEFAEAICGDGPTPMSNFPDYAGPLTETVLLGNLAVWQAGTEIQWNAETMEVVGGSEDVNRIVRPEYRNGYALM